MANGDIKQFGVWYVKKYNTSYYKGTQTDTIRIEHDNFTTVTLDLNNTTSDAKLEWVEYTIDGTKKYIPRNSVFNYISNNEIREKYEGKTVIIDGSTYKFDFMAADFWIRLPENVLSNILLKTDIQIMTTTKYEKGNITGFGYVTRKVAGVFSLDTSDYGYGGDNSSYYMSYVPVLTQINSSPVISGEDKDLGNKTSSFSISYSVSDADDGQELTVKEKINGSIIRTLQNPTQDSTLTFTISNELFASLSMNTTNTIEIEVTDGSATTYRRYTFVKTNSAPLINYSGQTDLGKLTSKPSISYSVNDNEGDEIIVTEKLNGNIIRTFYATQNTNYTITVSDEFWLSCSADTNTIEISASDINGGTSYKYITFTRQVNKVQITTKNAIETDAAATKIMVSPDWDKTGCTGKVEVCNNGFDDEPTWEDMTTMAALNRPYIFTNSTKTASKWGIKIRLTLTKNEGYTGEVAIYGFGGAYE